MELNDLFFKISHNLMELGYTDIRIVPFAVLEESIKKYITEKLQIEKLEQDTTQELMKRLADHIPESNRQFSMAKFTHYLLSVLSLIQGFEIVWYIEEEAKEPYLKYNKYFPDKYDGLVSTEDFDYMETFQVVLEKLQEKLPIETRGKVV